MHLTEFLEFFEPNIVVTILYYGFIEYSGKIVNMPLSLIMGREVIPGSCILSDDGLLLEVERTIPERNSDVIINWREDLSEEELLFVQSEITKLMSKLDISQDGIRNEPMLLLVDGDEMNESQL